MSSATDTIDKQLEEDDRQLFFLIERIKHNQVKIVGCPKRYDNVRALLEKADIELTREFNYVKKRMGERRDKKAEYLHEEAMLEKDAQYKRERRKEPEPQPPQYPTSGAVTADPKAQKFLDSITTGSISQ